MRPIWAGMHLECISIAAGIYFDIKRDQLQGMQFECSRNLSIAARMWLECSRNVPIGPGMSPDVIQNTAESHIQEYTKNFHPDVIPAHSASSVTGVWNSVPNVALDFLLIPNDKCDGDITEGLCAWLHLEVAHAWPSLCLWGWFSGGLGVVFWYVGWGCWNSFKQMIIKGIGVSFRFTSVSLWL